MSRPAGFHQTPEHREHLREALLVAQNRPEVKERHRQSALLAMNRPEVREKLSQSALGRKRTPETREKIRSTHNTPEYREKSRQVHLGPLSSFWRGGRSNEPYGIEFNEFLKSQIRDRDDHLCQMPNCYLSENGKKHDVHHIDYIKKHNHQENLITLCHKHHAQTNSGDRDRWAELLQEVQVQRGVVRC